MECCGGSSCGNGSCKDSEKAVESASENNNNNDLDEDIWGDDDEDISNNNIISSETSRVVEFGIPVENEDRETKALRRKFAKQGYIDGKSQWQELGLQQGFDKGYPLGAKLALECGEIIARFQTISTRNPVYLEEWKDCVQELNIQKVLDIKYFNEDTDLNDDNHPVISKWKDRLNEIQDKQG